MNVIWKEKCGGEGGTGARVELVFTPSDLVEDLNQQVVIAVSLFPLKKRDHARD